MSQANTYAEQQSRMDLLTEEEDLVHEVERLSHLSELLAIILDPSKEPDSDVRHRLTRLNAWGTRTVYPLLLHLLDRREQQSATSSEIASAMLYIESFFVRRLLIGRATANVNRILLDAVTNMSRDVPVDEAVLRYLSTGRKHFATDAEVRIAIRTIPFYLNGRAAQRALVLQWLEESYDSKEPVDFSSMTIEHVLPQTMTSEWLTTLESDLSPGEDIHQVYESILHTLGNLTLTGYNSSLSNSPFDIKKRQLAASGLLMNHEIAGYPRWGRPEIAERSIALAERIIEAWPGPTDAERTVDEGIAWDVMERALAEIPAGRWTTYGDVAALIGSHPVPVGQRLASRPTVNAHRVLKAGGTVSPSFRWLEPDRTDDPTDLLRQEGVEFDSEGRADPTQSLDTEALAALIGVETDDLPDGLADPAPGEDEARRDRFIAQLVEAQTIGTQHGALAVLDAWTKLGGELVYGKAGETSCFLVYGPYSNDRPWPMVIYPTSGRVEVVFQYLATRPPFDNVDLRQEMRRQLNEIDGIDLGPDTLLRRPNFDLEVVATANERDRVVDVLTWFVSHVAEGQAPNRRAPDAVGRSTSSAEDR